MTVRVSFREVSPSARLAAYLQSELSSLLPAKGFFGNLACDVIVRMHNGPQNRGADLYSCSIRLRGNKRLERVTVGKGMRVNVAVREALAKFERALGKEHERLTNVARGASRGFVASLASLAAVVPEGARPLELH